jgi:hypothetical protein
VPPFVIPVSSLFRHSAFSHSSFFYLVPNLIQFLQPDLSQLFALRVKLIFQSIEPANKLVGGALQSALGVQFAFPRQIHDRK